MPIKEPVDRLSAGIWTPLGLKIPEPKIAEEIAPGSRPYCSRGRYTAGFSRTDANQILSCDIDWKLEEPARYGLTMEQAQ
jgi:hypothetical protein